MGRQLATDAATDTGGTAEATEATAGFSGVVMIVELDVSADSLDLSASESVCMGDLTGDCSTSFWTGFFGDFGLNSLLGFLGRGSSLHACNIA